MFTTLVHPDCHKFEQLPPGRLMLKADVNQSSGHLLAATILVHDLIVVTANTDDFPSEGRTFNPRRKQPT